MVLVPPPALQPDPQLTLPLDINDYPMAKYVRGHFQVRWAPRGAFPDGQTAFGESLAPRSWWSSEVQGPPWWFLALFHWALPRLPPWGHHG